MKALLKWAGGKERELKSILPKSPKHINNYYEPFFGGGAVYFSIGKIDGRNFVNDASNELIDFYQSIKSSDKIFFQTLEQINQQWIEITKFFSSISEETLAAYKSYKMDEITDKEVAELTLSYARKFSIVFGIEITRRQTLEKEIDKSFKNKLKRTKKLEIEKGALPEEDLQKIFLSAFKSGYYTFVRALYNNPEKYELNSSEYNAIFLFIRMFCYSGMFRYNSSGDFNVPYGGIGYNNNNLSKKIAYYHSEALHQKFSETEFENLDFEDFLDTKELSENDFIFLDPPYDTEFSTYAQNEFNKHDQQRLANFLIHKTSAKWMLVIKSTEFILGLYKDKDLVIEAVDKKYNVSFMDRNNKDVTHLIIRNYE
jgi:DNA adenine methylase